MECISMIAGLLSLLMFIMLFWFFVTVSRRHEELLQRLDHIGSLMEHLNNQVQWRNQNIKQP
jgi:hypothetical protein